MQHMCQLYNMSIYIHTYVQLIDIYMHMLHMSGHTCLLLERGVMSRQQLYVAYVSNMCIHTRICAVNRYIYAFTAYVWSHLFTAVRGYRDEQMVAVCTICVIQSAHTRCVYVVYAVYLDIHQYICINQYVQFIDKYMLHMLIYLYVSYVCIF